MAPEQKDALYALRAGLPLPGPVDARADIYALGVVLCEALGADVSPDRLCRVPSDTAGVTRGLADILARCLAPDPAARYATTADLAADLRRHLNDQPLRGVPNRSLAECWGKWRRRSPYGLIRIALLMIFLATVAAGIFVASQDREREHHSLKARPAENLIGPLHELAEQLRRQHAAGFAPGGPLIPLERGARAIWAQRDSVARHRAEARGLEWDLIDVALLGIELRIVMTPGAAHAEALAILDEAERLFGPRRLFFLERARHAGAAGHPTLAAENLARADSQPVIDAEEHHRIGRSFAGQKRSDDAVVHLARAVELAPGVFWHQFHLGVCRYRCGRAAEAVGPFSACIALSTDADRATCYVNRALGYARLGEDELAQADYEQARQLDLTLAPIAVAQPHGRPRRPEAPGRDRTKSARFNLSNSGARPPEEGSN